MNLFLILLTVLDEMFGAEFKTHNKNAVSHIYFCTNLTFMICEICYNLFIAFTTPNLTKTEKNLFTKIFIIPQRQLCVLIHFPLKKSIHLLWGNIWRSG